MAESYSSTVAISGNYRKYRAYVSASIADTSNDYATVSYYYCVQMTYAYQYGVAANCYVNGSWQHSTSGYLSSNPGSSWATVCSGSGTTSIAKSNGAYNITVQCNAWGETVSGMGSAGGSTSCSVTLTVPVRTYIAHGNPTFSVDKTLVSEGEEVALTLTPSTTQGNANFNHFEISDGKGNIFFSSSVTTTPSTVTTTDVPSAVLERYGADEYLSGATGALEAFDELRPNCVYYAAREVHEWYGSYPASDWVWLEVEVEEAVSGPSTITFYDSNGLARMGIVTVYDAEGKARPGIITVYDASGAARNVVT